MKIFIKCIFLLLTMSISVIAAGEDSEAAPEIDSYAELMDNARLHDLLQRVDPNLEGRLGLWTMQFESIRAQVITDENADRMRVLFQLCKLKMLRMMNCCA